jgi:hypothetical protein
MRPVSKQVAWLCLVLLLLSAYGFAAHQHSSSGDETQCTICVVAHSTSPVATTLLTSAFLVLILFVVLAGPVPAKQLLVPFALTVRPPPAV